MFADVAGSTAMYENMGDLEARERISKALNTLISICNRHKGNLVKTIGDEILVYFEDADMSLLASEAIQKAMEDDRSPETIGISIRIGMHYGAVIKEEDDIFGDTVNVAARIVAMTKARQILFSEELANRVLSSDLQEKIRQYDRITVRGKEQSMVVYLFVWEQEADITNMATGNITNPFKANQDEGLLITYRHDTTRLDLASPAMRLGRGSDCDLLIEGDLISRSHAKIIIRRGKYVLVDQSTNGTYVRTLDGQDFFLRQDELTLFGSGVISLGKNVDKARDNLLYYTHE